MDCPKEFINDIPADDDDENYDPDAEMMKQEKPAEAKVDFDFDIMKPPLMSDFVEKNKASAEEEKNQAHVKSNTIDDDAPDLEKFDELEAKKKRIHCWILIK